jgi:hypothetical protein
VKNWSTLLLLSQFSINSDVKEEVYVHVHDDSSSLLRAVIAVRIGGMQSKISYIREWDIQDDIIHVQWIVHDI